MCPFSRKRYAALFGMDEASAPRSIRSVLAFYGQAFMLEPHATLAEMATGARHLSYRTMAAIFGCAPEKAELIDEWMRPRRFRFHRMFQAEPAATVRELIEATAPMPLEEIARREAELEGRADRQSSQPPVTMAGRADRPSGRNLSASGPRSTS